MILGTLLYTLVYGKRVGSDQFGNKYYRRKGGPRVVNNGRERRWVLYKGKAEASSVPPAWHGWLHHIVDSPPTDIPERKPVYEKPHLPNLTGTGGAYRPPGHVLRGGVREEATGDYEPWRPE
ncbi:MAG: NADH:ubiquinone oxidoreductase subunit NDUFA12 [Rhodospirillaceae bacterium]|jgi:NADH:ubiquinone oxidoreductase subunit|nr:NADH:ubiquinone oxidoreductase subunit NDUFA12 [Rhodospirillaceae bacterium]MBT5374914.1 NADH:ubiquinone oxidoreductase subunit NDUFA12 [Rhodospirillaceae bacterium]MBT5752001.1 NADH:ubiquinone oxidoreductase subunit NDUFA12 [Rhodospirillaceae bacterium]